MKKVEIKEDVRIPSTNIILENKDHIFFRESHLSNSDIYFAKQYWSDLCEDYKDKPQEFLRYIKNTFYKEMAKSLSLGEVWSYDGLKDKLDVFLLNVTNPVETEMFGKPISSKIF